MAQLPAQHPPPGGGETDERVLSGGDGQILLLSTPVSHNYTGTAATGCVKPRWWCPGIAAAAEMARSSGQSGCKRRITTIHPRYPNRIGTEDRPEQVWVAEMSDPGNNSPESKRAATKLVTL
jgi:hypothetical protein